MNNLAPEIFRQRLVIEGTMPNAITDLQIKDYLSKLSGVLKMRTVLDPVTHRSDKFGWAGWIHWETSGAHFYAWEQPRLFFSVDIYTCKEFQVQEAVDFTRDYFAATNIESKSF
jgi:S-adenosylmethionine/arginine decarboxylase-like enzyme